MKELLSVFSALIASFIIITILTVVGVFALQCLGIAIHFSWGAVFLFYTVDLLFYSLDTLKEE